MPVTRCICHNISFEELKTIAAEEGYSTMYELQAEQLCGTNCKLCQPYIEEMLRTGVTKFAVQSRKKQVP